MSENVDITFKTITQQTFVLNVPPSQTIGEIKKQIETDKGVNDFEVERQKLIYNGKVLEDTQTVGEVNIDPKKFIVIMVSRKPAAPVVTESKPDPVREPTALTSSAPAAPVVAPAAPAQAPAAAAAPAQPAALTPEQEEQVNNISAMGYPRDEVIRALRAAFFNADRAVEYLCVGIPEVAEVVGIQPANEEEQDVGGDELGGIDSLNFLRESPQFRQICQLVRDNPQMLPEVLNEVSQSNPRLFDTIRQNQADFLSMLNEGGLEEGEGAAPAGVGGGHPGGENAVIAISENDRDAIQRLRDMGFPEQLVIEAYFACDKNEDLAVNYILARMDE